MYKNILTSFSKDIVVKVDQITEHIKASTEHYRQYCIYKSAYETSRSESEDDWHVCILILKFIDSKISDLDEIILILKFFLYRDRYRNKLVDHDNYLVKTVNKAICHSLSNNLVGSCLNQIYNNNIHTTEFGPTDIDLTAIRLRKSISRSSVLKVCNLLNFFYLNTSKTSHNNLVVNLNISSDNRMKVHLQGGMLNHFDLTVLMAILYQYKKYILSSPLLFDPFKIDVVSVLKLIGYDTGYSRKKFLDSLKKLSMTTIDCRKQYMRFESNILKNSEDYFYSFCGNLLSFESLSTTELTSVNVQLSVPLVRMFESNNYYVLVSWEFFTFLSNHELHLLYFYLCFYIENLHI